LREEAFRQGLRDLGYIEGQTVAIESRYADGRFERLPDLAAELVRLKVDVIVASPGEAAQAAQRATRTIPIVMAFAGDPVGSGIVASLAHPGGNITGLSATVAEMAAKRVEFVEAIVPEMSRAAFLANAATVRQAVSGTEAAGRALGVQVSTVLVRDTGELERAFSTLKKGRVGWSHRRSHAPGALETDCGSGARDPAAHRVRTARVRGGWRPHGLRAELPRPLPPSSELRR
jgi:putative ABC transport system substrate-binding protein